MPTASPRGRSTSYTTTMLNGTTSAKRRRISLSPEPVDSSCTASTASSSSALHTSPPPPPGTMGLIAFANMLQPTRPSTVATTVTPGASTPAQRGIMSHVLTPSGNFVQADSSASRSGGRAASPSKAKAAQKQRSASATRRGTASTTAEGEGGSLLARARNMMPAASPPSSSAAARRRASSASPSPSVPLLHRASQMRESATAEVQRIQADQAEQARAMLEARRAEYLSSVSAARVLASPTPAPNRPAAVIRAPPPPPPPPYVPTQPISILLPSLDVLLACQPLHAIASEPGNTPVGLRPGSLMEITGPPGSGKTALMASMAVNTRLQSLLREADVALRMRAELPVEEREREELAWDDIAKGAEQVLIIDTEGGLLPPRLLQAARAQVKALSTAQVCLSALPEADSTSTAPGPRVTVHESASRKALLCAILSGLLLTRSTTLASLIAYLQLCFPEPSLSAGASRASVPPSTHAHNDVASSHLPPRTSLVLLDSVSHHLRGPDSGKKLDRQARALALSTLSTVAVRAKRARISLVLSNQMAVKMFTPDGVLSNFRQADARGMLVPQLVAPTVQDEAPSRELLLLGPPRDESEAARAYAARGSTLGRQTWRVTLFKRGEAGQCYAQIVGRPVSLPASAAPPAPAPGAQEANGKQALPWHTWIPFDIDEHGTPTERAR